MNNYIDIKTLNIFTTVFKQKSISGASRILNVTQPSVSRTILNLENSLGFNLFYRTPEGLIPTDNAILLYKRAITIINDVDNLIQEASNLSSKSKDLINIGVGHGCSLSIKRDIDYYIKERKDLIFNLEINSAKTLVSEGEKGLFEIIVGNESILKAAKWLTKSTYKSQKSYIIANKGHSIFKEDEENQINEIYKYPSLTYHLVEYSHKSKGTNSPAFRINDYLVLLDSIKNSDSYMIISEEQLPFLEMFNLKIVGNREINCDNFLLAYNAKTISKEALKLVQFLTNKNLKS